MGKGLTYAVWKQKHHPILGTLSEKKVILSFSAGKDSSVLLHYLQKASREYGFKFEVHGVTYPCHVFTEAETTGISDFWRKRQVEIAWHGTGGIDDSKLGRLKARGESPCVHCSQTKKIVLMTYFKLKDFALEDVVIVIGYTLWDLVSATLEHQLRTCFGNTDSGRFQGKLPQERFLEISQRFYPWLKLKKGPAIFKPLIHFNDPDIQEVIARNKILVTKNSCSFKGCRPKRLLAGYYTTFELKFDFNKVFDFAHELFNLPGIEHFETLDRSLYLNEMI